MSKQNFIICICKWRLCGDKDETVNYIIRVWIKLAQKNSRAGWLCRKGNVPGIVQETKI